MKIRIVFVFAFLFAVSFLTGCGGERRPQGFPKTYKCQLKVVESGSPVSGVIVKLETSDPNTNKWGPCGTTGEDGVAVLQTRGFSGVPLGEYKVLLEKRGEPMREVSPGIYEAVDDSNQLDPDYADAEATPFAITAVKKQETVPTFDIADGSTK